MFSRLNKVTKSINIKSRLLTIQPRSVFLIDAAGAFATSFTIGFILPLFKQQLGSLPQDMYYLLSSIAFFYGVYSLYHYAVPVKSWRFRLWVISTANILYGVMTLIIVALFMENLTALGLLYFVTESAIIIWLSRLEYWYSGKKVTPLNINRIVPRSIGKR